MSEEAKKKAATAAKQAKHAVSNVEEAAQLQAEEVVQIAAQEVSGYMRPKNILIGGALFAGGAATYHLTLKGINKLKQRKKSKDIKIVEDERSAA
jgi:hypothetical protein